MTKFGGTNIKLVCDDVDFLSEYSSSTGMLSISNIGNVPIYGIKARVSGEGSYQTLDMGDLGVGWPEIGLRQGGVFSGSLYSEFYEADEVLLIPVLMGASEKGNQVYVCEERHGQEVMI